MVKIAAVFVCLLFLTSCGDGKQESYVGRK